MIFQRFSQNKYKRKRENRCHVTLKPLKGGRTNDFGSSRSLNNRFCGLGRKNRFGPKLREAVRTFSTAIYLYRDQSIGAKQAQKFHTSRPRIAIAKTAHYMVAG